MNSEMSNNKTESSEHKNKVMKYKLKNLNTTIKAQNEQISELKSELALAEIQVNQVKNQIDGVKGLFNHKIKEIEKENEVLDKLQNAVWKLRKDYETKITETSEALQIDIEDNDVKKMRNDFSVLKGESNFYKYYLENSRNVIITLQKSLEEYKVKKEILQEKRKNV